MTEAEWMACADPETMLAFLRETASDRKLRLFACACCRRIWPFITDPGSQEVVEITEQWADGFVDQQRIQDLNFDRLTDDCGFPEEPFRMAFMVAGHVGHDFMSSIHGFSHDNVDAFEIARDTASGAREVMANSFRPQEDKFARHYDSEELMEIGRRRTAHIEAMSLERQASEEVQQCSLLRCIFGNPFRPSSLAPGLVRDGMIRALVYRIYADRDFSALPLLADALEKAGCVDSEILAHCCESGNHVRGCWVVDMILGKQ
jgi:hypothetical protein